MAGNFNYTTRMNRNQFYDEYAELSLMNRELLANNPRFGGDYNASQLFSSPGYRQNLVDGKGRSSWVSDFNNAYGSYNRTFDGRIAATAVAEAQQQQQIATANRLRIQQEQRLQRINTNAAATRGSLQILGQPQQAAPNAQTSKKKKSGRGGAGRTATNISRGSSRSRGTNLSI